MKISIYEIFFTTNNTHFDGSITFLIDDYSNGLGKVIFKTQGLSEVANMRNWECEYRNLQDWRFTQISDTDVNEITKIENTIPHGRIYSSPSAGNKYIRYSVSNKLSGDTAGPGEGSGTAGNTGGD